MPTGACGINCDVCRLNLLGICSTCGPGKSQDGERKLVAQERILGSPCPILACAFRHGVDYCPKDCDRFPCHEFESLPYPYSQGFLNMQARRRKQGPKTRIPCGLEVKVPTRYWEDLEQRDMVALCKNALAGTHSPDGIVLAFLGEELLVNRKDRGLYQLNHDQWDRVEHPLLETLCLVYLLNVGPQPLSHDMVSVSDLRDAHFFKGPHELKVTPLLERYGNDLDGFKRAAERLAGEGVELADVAYRIRAFPKVPIYYLFWQGEEEFAPRLSILFDRSIEHHLSADAIWGLTNLVSDILLMGDQWLLT
jgi:hypothetical protein